MTGSFHADICVSERLVPRRRGLIVRSVRVCAMIDELVMRRHHAGRMEA
jgi:hypothetical protein